MTYRLLLLLIALIFFIAKTSYDFVSPYEELYSITSNSDNFQILDRHETPLTFSYRSQWNVYENMALHEIPEILQQAFILAEDKRFFEHCGIDLLAKGNAIWQSIYYGKTLRGASTITEQVVRMLHPRPRSLWSKWIEGLEALALEKHSNKAQILEFYLNQVPYASNRRGISQAARFYFDRSINTLSPKEILALAILVRAPSKFDPHLHKVKIEGSIERLATRLAEQSLLDNRSAKNIKNYSISLDTPKLPIEAPHFIDYTRKHTETRFNSDHRIVTTLDGQLQLFTQRLLENRLRSLASKNINNAAALIVNHQTHDVLVWVSAGLNCNTTNNQASGCKIDMVTTPRQPGSALKPFLYAAALEKGWNPATIIDDSPYSESVGKGIHHFRNYSHTHYGKVSLRSALGNSLNIPAIHAINYVTPEKYLFLLRRLGFESLTRSFDFYDKGLALGNGEVTLLELVQAYSTLANKGVFEPLNIKLYNHMRSERKLIFSEETASLIGNILSDPWARSLEFGRSSALNLPTQTAVKTGTSTDYRDAWAVGYNHKYVVGVWMGNIDYTPTDGITGSIGPALAIRAIFNELTKNSDTAPLFLSPKLINKQVCINPNDIEQQNINCPTYSEYFLTETQEQLHTNAIQRSKINLFRPSHNLDIALDPRIPIERQAFEMRVTGAEDTDFIQWYIDDKIQTQASGARLLWPIEKGIHEAQVVIWRDGKKYTQSEKNRFHVK